MRSVRSKRRVPKLLALLAAGVAAACGTSDPLAVDTSVVLMGRVATLGPVPAGVSGDSEGFLSLEGIEVSAEGSAATTTTAADGSFRLELEAAGGTVILHFRRGLLDARLEIDGVAAGTILRFEVSLTGDIGTVIVRHDRHLEDFEGHATLVSVLGDAPARTLRVELDGSAEVDIVEGSTVFEADGDILDFDALLVALGRTDLTVRMEGDAEVGDGGAAVATSVKVETDEHVGAGDDNSGPGSGGDDGVQAVRFEGSATLVAESGSAPTRIAHVRVISSSNVWLVDVIEGGTSFDTSGDLRSFGSLVTALSASALVRVEGRGTETQAGAILASVARAELD